MSKETAREYLEKGCNEYLRLFCEKHEFDYEDARNSLPNRRLLDVFCIGDYFVDMRDIITDIEQDAPEDEYEKWYFYTLDAHNLGLTAPNYPSWLKGCPRCSQGEINRLYDLKREFEQAVKEAKTKY